MANNKYPSTTLQPTQTLDFTLSDGKRVRVVLNPRPDSTGMNVHHVDLQFAQGGSFQLNAVGNGNAPRTVLQAGIDAYQLALHESKRWNAQITEAILEGEEFLEKADVEQIVGNSFPVNVA